MRGKWAIGIVVVALAAGLLYVWWSRQGPLTVTLVSPRRGPAIDAIYATGTVEPTVMLPVAPRVAGRITELRVDEGRRVRKGEVLARLDTSDLDSTVEELTARARYARSEFDRVAALVQRGVAAVSDRDRTRADLDAAEAALRRARAQRDFMVLTSPAVGEVIRRDGEVGQFIPVGQAVFYLSCCAPLRVTADVDEEDIPRVYAGQKVVLRADALPGRTFDGQVGDVTPKGDPVARSYRVRIRLATPAEFKVGMTVDANVIVAERQNALLIPSSAIKNGSVWVVRDGRLARRPVTVGVSGPTDSEILAGLAADAVLVEVPTDDLAEGRAVHPRTASAAQTGPTGPGPTGTR
jgi:RND family efflux transporter MFP subunit